MAQRGAFCVAPNSSCSAVGYFHDKAVDLIAEVVAQFLLLVCESITSSIVLQTLRLLFTRKPAFSEPVERLRRVANGFPATDDQIVDEHVELSPSDELRIELTDRARRRVRGFAKRGSPRSSRAAFSLKHVERNEHFATHFKRSVNSASLPASDAAARCGSCAFCVTSSPIRPSPRVTPRVNTPFSYCSDSDNPSIFNSATYSSRRPSARRRHRSSNAQLVDVVTIIERQHLPRGPPRENLQPGGHRLAASDYRA